MSLKIVFFGTPKLAATILDYLISHHANIVAVVTKPDKPIKRSNKPVPSPVKDLILQKNLSIPILQPEKASAPEFVNLLKNFHADLFIVAAYSEIFKNNLLELPKYGCINVHPSLLPKYRGAAPIPRAIMNGDKETGVAIMKMAAKLDAGAILKSVKTPIDEEINTQELSERLANLGAEALWEVIQAFEKGEVYAIEQNDQQSSYAAKLTPEDGYINWDNAAAKIHCQIRGVTPKPGAWCWITHKGIKKRFLIKKACLVKVQRAFPGSILDSSPNTLLVACRSDALSLLEVQMEGKKTMSIDEFLRGIAKKDLLFSSLS